MVLKSACIEIFEIEHIDYCFTGAFEFISYMERVISLVNKITPK